MKSQFRKIVYIFLFVFHSATAEDKNLTAQQIIQNVINQQVKEPYIYQELVMLLIDDKQKKDTRKLRFYCKSSDTETKMLLAIDSPEETRGVALRAKIDHLKQTEQYHLYLPNLDKGLLKTGIAGRSDNIFGSDLSALDFLPEQIEKFTYKKLKNSIIEDVEYWNIEASPIVKEDVPDSYSKRILQIKKDHLLITQIKYFNNQNQLIKTKTSHEYKKIISGHWQPSMILVENHQKKHKTLVKTEKHLYSADYVNDAIFTDNWIKNNNHLMPTEEMLYKLGNNSK